MVLGRRIEMLKSLAIVVALSACTATTGLPLRDSVRPPSITLAPAGSDATASFPERQSRDLVPTADQLRVALRATGHERLTAGLRICVAPDGTTRLVAIERTTGSVDLDRALARDLSAWRYGTFPGPDSVRVCKRVTLTYIP
jgi:hypothetical protein